MKSKVAKRIQKETPEEVRFFVRQYADIIVRANDLLQQKAIQRRNLSKGMK
ncbi:MAG TPA: hypothetical protein PKE30_02475 [Niabella sp.]|nr:hypothetical protein [Niabella sp.]